jgi:hypothetical protein
MTTTACCHVKCPGAWQFRNTIWQGIAMSPPQLFIRVASEDWMGCSAEWAGPSTDFKVRE